MPLYLINGTKQKIRFYCRRHEHPRPIVLEVESGCQIRADKHHDDPESMAWGQDDIKYVIEQFERYGVRELSEVDRINGRFDGLLYSTKKPASEDAIITAHNALIESKEEISAQEATKSALAFDQAGRNKRGPRIAKEVAVEVSQIIPRGEKPTGKEINFGLSVATDGSNRVKLPI